MVPEAKIVSTESGLVPEGEGWFVVNAREARWWHSEELGSYCPFEDDGARFPGLGININVLPPGEPNCMYHGEGNEEVFLVLSGECLLLIEGEERPLKAWDFVYCPPWAEHVFVASGSGPCVVLAASPRRKGAGVRYPVAEIALKHGAGVTEETTEPAEAYARFERPQPGRYRDGHLPG